MQQNLIHISALDNQFLNRIDYADNIFPGATKTIYSYVLDLYVLRSKGCIVTVINILDKINDENFVKLPNSSGTFEFTIIQKDNTKFLNIKGEEVFEFNQERTQVLTTQLDGKTVPLSRTLDFTKNVQAMYPIIKPGIQNNIANFLGNHPIFIADDNNQ